MNDLLRITSLSKNYDGFALNDINLSVPSGSVVGFIGSNGAGKTTTIKAVLGLIKPDGGYIDLLGERITDAPPVQLAEAKQRIGVVLDSCSFPDEMTVAAVGKLMKASYRTWNAEAFTRFTSTFKLPANKLVKDLSRGMSMKLTLATALAHNPDLLILDEATAGLDPLAREDVLDTLRLFMDTEGRGILMSSHITSDLEKIADYIVCIDDGRLVFSVEKDVITDLAGIAQCRATDFDAIIESGFFAPGELRFQKNTYGIVILAPDRQAFSRKFPTISIDRADIDTYMTLKLKGDVR